MTTMMTTALRNLVGMSTAHGPDDPFVFEGTPVQLHDHVSGVDARAATYDVESALAALAINIRLPIEGPHLVLGEGGTFCARVVWSPSRADGLDMLRRLVQLASDPYGVRSVVERPPEGAAGDVASLYPLRPRDEPSAEVLEALARILSRRDAAARDVGRHHRYQGGGLGGLQVAQPRRARSTLAAVALREQHLLDAVLGCPAALRFMHSTDPVRRDAAGPITHRRDP